MNHFGSHKHKSDGNEVAAALVESPGPQFIEGLASSDAYANADPNRHFENGRLDPSILEEIISELSCFLILLGEVPCKVRSAT